MSEDTKAVETVVNAAPQPGVDTVPAAPHVPTIAEVELSAELEAVRIEKDNYKRGLLKAKGKLPDDEQPDLDQLVSQKVAEALESSKASDLERKEKELVDKILQENKELKLARQNREQISTAPQGTGNTGTTSTTDTFFSPEQLAYFKQRKLDPEKVKANILKNRT